MVICEYRICINKGTILSTPYIIKEYDNVRIAIVGLTADGLMKTNSLKWRKRLVLKSTIIC